MKKLIFAAAVALFSIAGAQAQVGSDPAALSIAVNVGIPTNAGVSLAYGADLQIDFPVALATKITASAGYEGYTWKASSGSFGMIPLLAGVKFNLGERAYAHGQLGYGISTSKGGGGSFAYAPSLGYFFSQHLDASVKYLAFSKDKSTTGSVNLRLAYNL